MTSWRDGLSQTTQDEIDGMFGHSFPFAEQCLQRYGEFFPNGFTLNNEGVVAQVAGYTGQEQPASEGLLKLLYAGIRQQSASLRAAAVVADVRIEASDAVQIEIEHCEGVAITLLIPYHRDASGTVAIGQVSAQAGTQRIWGAATQ